VLIFHHHHAPFLGLSREGAVTPTAHFSRSSAETSALPFSLPRLLDMGICTVLASNGRYLIAKIVKVIEMKLMKVIAKMENTPNTEFQPCVESKLIEVMIYNMQLIQFVSIVNLIQMKLIKMIDNMKNMMS
jgi:hypothetical protein